MFRTILIHLGDNDFHHTFTPLLETIWRVLADRDEYYINKEFITRIILEGIKFHYLAFQARDAMISDTDYIAKYLTGIEVLFDEEAEKYIEEHGGDSGSWYLEVQTGKVYYV